MILHLIFCIIYLHNSFSGQKDCRANSFVGTAEYVSPELLTAKSACKASDIWALGCIVYQLLAGKPPFHATTEYLVFQRITKLDLDIPGGFPEVGSDLVTKLLVLDPTQRLGSESFGGYELLKAHDFYNGELHRSYTKTWFECVPCINRN